VINFKNCLFTLTAFLIIVFCACVKVPEYCGDGHELNPETQFCFKEKTYQKCQGGEYNPESEFCSENDNEVYKKCGGGSGVYNTAAYQCGDDGKLIPSLKQFTVTFDTDGGTPVVIGPVTVYYGSSLGESYPANPKKEGYVFAGWFDKGTMTKPYSASTEITGDADLTAKWVEEGTVLSEFTDTRDGKKYRTVLMPDGKIWMAENLSHAAAGGFCHSNSDCEKYGLSYTWENAKKACPSGWHLPTRQEWADLACAVTVEGGGSAVGNCSSSGSNAGTMLKSKTDWNGTDDFEFSALPGGYVAAQSNSLFDYGINGNGYWWTDTGIDTNNAHSRNMTNSNNHTGESTGNKNNRLSVRCVKD